MESEITKTRRLANSTPTMKRDAPRGRTESVESIDAVKYWEVQEKVLRKAWEPS